MRNTPHLMAALVRAFLFLILGLAVALPTGCRASGGSSPGEAKRPTGTDNADSAPSTRPPEPHVHTGQLPAGFVAVAGAPLHPSGWPMEIRCLKDDSLMVLVPAGETQVGLTNEQVAMLAKVESPWTQVGDNAATTHENAMTPGTLLTNEDIAAARFSPGSVPLAVRILAFIQEDGGQVPTGALDGWRKNGRTAEVLLTSRAAQDALERAIVNTFKKDVREDRVQSTVHLMKAHSGHVLTNEDLQAFEAGSVEQQAAVFVLWVLQPTEEPFLPPEDLQQWRKDGRTLTSLLATPRLRNVLLKAAQGHGDPSKEAQIREMFPPARKVTMGAFYIDKYEITNAQYRRFFDQANDPQRKPGVWYGGEWNLVAPEQTFYDHWSDATRNANDQPVTCVGKRDVLEYARWSAKQIPNRDEWERAARGDGSRLFPWGNDFKTGYCSCNISTPRQSQPAQDKLSVGVVIRELRCLRQEWRKLREGIPPARVGQSSHDVSPYGCYDMAGNVSELASAVGGVDDGDLMELGGNSESFWPQYVSPAGRAFAGSKRLVGFRTILRLDAPPRP